MKTHLKTNFMKTIIIFAGLFLLALILQAQPFHIGDHYQGGIIVSVDGRTGLMISENDFPVSPNGGKGWYKAADVAARECRVGGHNDWRIPTLSEWTIIRNNLYKKYTTPTCAPWIQAQTGLNTSFPYCVFSDSNSFFMYSLYLPKVFKVGGTMYGNLRLVRNYRYGEIPPYMPAVTRLGARYHGGTVFQLDEDGQHGFVFSASLGRTSLGQAIELCDDYSTIENGITFNDWYLPTIEDLFKMRLAMKHFMDLGIFPMVIYISGVHWSSTPEEGTMQWMDLIFNQGREYPPGKTFPTEKAYVRAIHAF